MMARAKALVSGYRAGMVASVVALVLLAAAARAADDKVTIGESEVVKLLPQGVKVPARIDTGAARTSLEARDLEVEDKLARFRLREEVGGLSLTLPVIGWRTYKSPGSSDRRPVVEIELCLGTRRFRTEANLNERSHLEFALLVGRDVLEGNFVVDVSRSNTLPANCDTGAQP